jgi:hypothetical protein
MGALRRSAESGAAEKAVTLDVFLAMGIVTERLPTARRSGICSATIEATGGGSTGYILGKQVEDPTFHLVHLHSVEGVPRAFR